MPMNIPRAIGNAGNFAGEFLMNLADPNRKRYQQASELARQKYLYDVQSEFAKQSALAKQAQAANEAALEKARLEEYGKLAVSRQIPNPLRARSLMMMGYGPVNIPDNYVPLQTPLEQAQAFNYMATGQKALEPRAPNQYDYYGELTPDQRARALGALPPEATPQPPPTELDWLKLGLDATKAMRPTMDYDWMNEELYTKVPGLTDEQAAPFMRFQGAPAATTPSPTAAPSFMPFSSVGPTTAVTPMDMFIKNTFANADAAQKRESITLLKTDPDIRAAALDRGIDPDQAAARLERELRGGAF